MSNTSLDRTAPIKYPPKPFQNCTLYSNVLYFLTTADVTIERNAAPSARRKACVLNHKLLNVVIRSEPMNNKSRCMPCCIQRNLLLRVFRAAHLPNAARCHIDTDVTCGGLSHSPPRTLKINAPTCIQRALLG